jgi:hypothetical protein
LPESDPPYLENARSFLRSMALALGAERTEISELHDGESLALRMYVANRAAVILVAGRELARLLTDGEMETQIRERMRALLAALKNR